MKKYKILTYDKSVTCNAFTTKKTTPNQNNFVNVWPLCTIDVIRHAEFDYMEYDFFVINYSLLRFRTAVD